MNKKILIIYAKDTFELLNRQSALGSYIFCLCNILNKNNFSVFINGISFENLQQNKNTKIHTTQKNKKWIIKFIPKLFKDFIKDIIVFKNVNNLSQHIKSNNTSYDCILEFYNYGSNVGFNISNQQKIPLIVVYDAPVLEEYIFFHGYKYFFKRKIEKRELKTLKSADHIIVYSNPVKNYLNTIISKKANISIHQNVDFTRFDFIKKKFDKKNLNIAFIGSFLKWHRIDLLLNVFEELRKQNYDVKLFLIGYGIEFESVKKAVEQSHYKDHITLPGFLDGQELLEIKQKLHIGVMPGSNWYGAPNKIFEYGAAGMAVVAPNTPTIADLFENEKNVLLFEQDNLDSLFQKLKMLCDDLTLSEYLANALQQKIENKYSEKNTIVFYTKLLNFSSQ